ncbi:MAG TPA: chorismate synthase [Acholeplasma sp.]|nr:chorismate synthase [Acholeplasma sp.]
MAFSLGKNLRITIFGEAHSEKMGVVIEGLPVGKTINIETIKANLALRRSKTCFETKRVEDDEFEIVSGYFNNRTTGGPVAILVSNKRQKSSDYDPNTIRPSHADYVSKVKYDGFNDYRGGGIFSGRLTVLLVIAGSICLDLLQEKEITIETNVTSIGGESKEYETLLEETVKEKDSLGGIIQVTVNNLPVGLGEPYFDKVDALLARALFSVPSVKGVSFGLGFAITKLKGSEANDEFYYNEGRVKTKTNHSGGINGGITNGMPLVINVALRPTPSIGKVQDSISLDKKENVKLELQGRYDTTHIFRTQIVLKAVVALVLYDLFRENKKTW